jgi:Methyltransferase domain
LAETVSFPMEGSALGGTHSAPALPRRPGDLLRRWADVTATGSFSNSRRGRRFEPFARLIEALGEELDRPVRIVDIGGTNLFWEQRGWAGRSDVSIVLVNLAPENSKHENIEALPGDATSLSRFDDGSFDVVFSNSVIEHLATLDRQAMMAAEVRRLAPCYWVQTPNFWFPIEPHFLTPGWHWLPVRVRVALLRRRRWGWRGPCPDPQEARELVAEVRLMRAGELRRLFPDADLRRERIGPFVKSFVALRTHDR